MFGNYVYEKSFAAYANKVLLVDEDRLDDAVHYSSVFSAHGFECVKYENDLMFRIEYEDKLLKTESKIVVIADSNNYIPYDIRKRFVIYTVSLPQLFPKMNAGVLREFPENNLDLLCMAYKENYDDLTRRSDAERFIREKVYSRSMVSRLLEYRYAIQHENASEITDYRQWFPVAEEKASIDVMAAQYGIEIDTSALNIRFRDWVLDKYGKLSSVIDQESPILVSRAMEYMRDHSSKFVIIVMDGMSEFDWNILSASFSDIQYEQAAVFAMIPTVTSVSRQCLLSNKYPVMLMSPWTQSKEKSEFWACAKNLGYADNQIAYERGYDAQFGAFVRCGAVIINDIDDMVHGQLQGRTGMYNDVSLLSKQGRLATLTRRLLHQGFDVYISADHGNTPCTGMGKLMGTGVETETKSHRMLVLKDFADKDVLKEKYHLIEFPKYYLMKEFDYLICDVGTSFDAKNSDVMNHGGITLDEVVVPFIKIKAAVNNE